MKKPQKDSEGEGVLEQSTKSEDNVVKSTTKTKKKSKKSNDYFLALKWLLRVSFLLCSVIVTLTAMTLCVISSFMSMRDLNIALETYLNVNKARKVSQIEES